MPGHWIFSAVSPSVLSLVEKVEEKDLRAQAEKIHLEKMAVKWKQQ